MNVSAKAEEILEALWITTEEKGEDAAHFERLDIAPEDEGLTELIGLAYVEVNGEWVRLRKEGREEARQGETCRAASPAAQGTPRAPRGADGRRAVHPGALVDHTRGSRVDRSRARGGLRALDRRALGRAHR